MTKIQSDESPLCDILVYTTRGGKYMARVTGKDNKHQYVGPKHEVQAALHACAELFVPIIPWGTTVKITTPGAWYGLLCSVLEPPKNTLHGRECVYLKLCDHVFRPDGVFGKYFFWKQDEVEVVS